MYNPFNSNAGFGAPFIKWMNELIKTLGIDISSLKSNVLSLTQRTERVLDQSKHFDDIDAKLTELAQKLGELEAGSQDNEVIEARHGYSSLSAFLESLANDTTEYSIRTAHKQAHEAGGFDPLDLYKLKNGDIVKQQMEDMQKNAVSNWRDVVTYYKVPQGIVNNAAALIQQAINECAPLDVWVVVPEGNYFLEKSLITKKGLKMIINKNATFYRYHTNVMVMNGESGNLVGQDDIWIDGGTWDVRGHLIDHDGSGFAFGYAKNITLRNAEILNVNFSHGVELAAIEGANIEYVKCYGFIDNTGTRGYAESIQIESGTKSGFPYFGSGANQLSKHIRIKGCTAGASDVAGAWNVGIGTHTDATITVADDISIIDCNYTEVLDTGIIANGYKTIYIERTPIESRNGIKIAHDGITETNFTLRDSNVRAIDGPALYLYGVTKGLVEHNVLDGYTNAIYGKNTKGVDIINKNDLSGQTGDAYSFSDGSSDITAQGNIIRKAGRHGFNAYQNVSHLRFYDNEILDVTVNAFNFQGENAVGIVGRGNKIKDTSLNAVLLASSAVSALIFKDNFYPSAITNPLQSTAVNSDTTGNKAVA